ACVRRARRPGGKPLGSDPLALVGARPGAQPGGRPQPSDRADRRRRPSAARPLPVAVGAHRPTADPGPGPHRPPHQPLRIGVRAGTADRALGGPLVHRAVPRPEAGTRWRTCGLQLGLGFDLRGGQRPPDRCRRRHRRLPRPRRGAIPLREGPPAGDQQRAARHPRPADHLRRGRAGVRLGPGPHLEDREGAAGGGDHPASSGAQDRCPPQRGPGQRVGPHRRPRAAPVRACRRPSRATACPSPGSCAPRPPSSV
ncbi:MAG: Type II/IV secretion system protein TadC, associated with Flp pilus assembly, partial [uncultured Acidimicrobiales bacterium]